MFRDNKGGFCIVVHCRGLVVQKGAGGVVLEKKKNIIVSSNVDVKMQGA